jgi:hypothetical protein
MNVSLSSSPRLYWNVTLAPKYVNARCVPMTLNLVVEVMVVSKLPNAGSVLSDASVFNVASPTTVPFHTGPEGH